MSVRLARVKNDLTKALMSIFLKLNLRSILIKQIYLSKDLKFATIEIGSIDEIYSNEEMLRFLERKVHLIKKNLKTFISLKYTPAIRFILDTHKERIDNVENIFKTLDKEKLLNTSLDEPDTNSND